MPKVVGRAPRNAVPIYHHTATKHGTSQQKPFLAASYKARTYECNSRTVFDLSLEETVLIVADELDMHRTAFVP